MDGAIWQDFSKNKREHTHHDQWVQKTPKYTEGHVTVANLEIFKYEVLQNKAIVSRPHKNLTFRIAKSHAPKDFLLVARQPSRAGTLSPQRRLDQKKRHDRPVG